MLVLCFSPDKGTRQGEGGGFQDQSDGLLTIGLLKK